MEIKNKKIIDNILNKLTSISKKMPNKNSIELVNLNDCLGRKVAEDIYAENDYPEIKMSKIEGKLLNINHNINSVEEFKKIENDVSGSLALGENPFILSTENNFSANIGPYMKVGKIGNTVIPIEKYLPWFDAAFLKNSNSELLKEIKVGEGIIEVGVDYKKNDLILKKDDIITNAKKALIRQAGIKEINVYKNIKIAILCVDYEFEELNKNFELEYIQDCMKSWGYKFELIKVKPFNLEFNNNRNFEKTGMTTTFKIYLDEIKKITESFDYIVACGLSNSNYFSRLGLFKQLNFLHKLSSQGENEDISFIGNYFKMMVGSLRSPIQYENITYYNKEGIPISNRRKSYEDRAIISYIPGYILDIIINMQIFIKPTILSRIYGKPFFPNFKIGKLTHDFEVKDDYKYKNKFLWAFSSNFTYSESGELNVKEIPEIKILNIGDERPDQLSFMKYCNCFIPMINNNLVLKKDDYIYYLEI